MSIIGHGVDIVEVSRIARMVQDYGPQFLDRCFTRNEQDYCQHRAKRLAEHLAGRFAAKEAVLKVIGTGWRDKIAWTDIEIINDAAGKPSVRLTGECARIAAEAGITHWHVSISHIESVAMASAIGERT